MSLFVVVVGLLLASAAGVYLYGVVSDRRDRARLPALLEERGRLQTSLDVGFRQYLLHNEKLFEKVKKETAPGGSASNKTLEERLEELDKESAKFKERFDEVMKEPGSKFVVSEKDAKDRKRIEEVDKEVARILVKNPDLDPQRGR